MVMTVEKFIFNIFLKMKCRTFGIAPGDMLSIILEKRAAHCARSVHSSLSLHQVCFQSFRDFQ